MKFLIVAITWLSTTTLWSQHTAPQAEDHIYRSIEVDEKPELIDGNYTLAMFVGKHFQLPDLHNKKVKIFMGFVVEKDGSISAQRMIHMDVKPLYEAQVEELTEEERLAEKQLLKQMEDEALRVLLLFEGKWKPAVKEGKIVRCQYNIPFNLNLE